MERSCMGERYLGCGSKGEEIILNGTPGNALGAYLDGSNIVVNGNAQDAMGDTMNAGSITVHGGTGDACGYAMRGGEIYVRDSVGYRAGIHMKAYKEKLPVLVIGGRAGSFLGEYQAGGLIIVLGLGFEGKGVVGYFCGTGMHGGKIYLRTDTEPQDLPEQVMVSEATEEDMQAIDRYINSYCDKFNVEKSVIENSKFYVLTPNTKNPYKRLYCYN
ncbi:MAG: glutamate synthase [Clostridiales bacterium GWF2_36_10]|nr:MAG: glutamate synthase [Clostridiales bacterium GWF2_36_10]HAN21398.1 glutamate synthase [Clostridiales bacterium]